MRIIVWVGCEEMFWVVVAINDNFTQCIVNMYILASLTYKMFQKLCEQTKPIPAYQEKYHRIIRNVSTKQ